MLRLIPAALLLGLLACAPTGTGGSDGETTAGSTAGSASGPTTGTSTGTGATTGTGTQTGAATEPGTSTGGEPGNLFTSDRFLTIAHRGGGLLRPEETLLAFENALAVGADVLEFDLHLTADGVLVAIHDDSVDRTTDGTGAVADMTLAELQALDAGYRFTPDDGASFPYRGTGLVVPTLDEIFQSFPDEYYLIEIKTEEPAAVDALVAALTQYGVRDRVVIASFSDETIAAVRAAAPDLFTALSLVEMVELNANLGDPGYTPPGGFVQAPWASTTQEVVDFSHQLGLKVHPWTVNDAGTMTNLIARGVDGIMTDDPALLAGLAPP